MSGTSAERWARLYLRASDALRRCFAVARGVHDGVWLGLCTRQFLHALDSVFYGTQGQYVDDDYTRSGLKDWEQAAVDRWFSGCRRLVVSGAGGGREVLALHRADREVVGFDPNEAMVQAGSRLLAEEAPGAQLLVAPRDEWPPLEGPYDGVIIGWSSYTHIVGRDRRVAFLRRARSLVPVGAPLLVSFYARHDRELYFRVARAVGNRLRLARRQPPVELGDGLAPYYAHHFSKREIAAELTDAGFELVHHQSRPFGHAVARSVGSAT